MQYDSVTMTSRRRAIAMAVLVGAAYYLGARLGFLLQLPGIPTSILWPPNAILTAALLLTPVGRWWMLAVAIVPAHLLVQVGVVKPPLLIAALFATNWSEALIAAVGVRLFSDAPARLDTLRRAGVFILAAGLVAPFVSSFLDAAMVTWFARVEYWHVWRTRFFANVLTEVTLAAGILAVLGDWRRWLAVTPRRLVEAAALAAALFVIASAVLDSDLARRVLDLPSATLVLGLLPVLLWGAVRFGAAGASLSLLLVSTVGLWGAQHGKGPFAALPVDERVLVLQLSVTMVAIPLLCLAAVESERHRAKIALNDNLRFEELLSELSSAFVQVRDREIDEAVRTWLARLGEFLGLRRLSLSRASDDGTSTEWQSWSAPASAGDGSLPVSSDATFAIPLIARGRVLGRLTVELPTGQLLRPRDWISRLAVVAEVFGSTLADAEAQEALRASESMKSAILASLTTRVAVLDRAARIVAVNEAWTRAAAEPGLAAGGPVAVGTDYLACWRGVECAGNPFAKSVVAGIEDVLEHRLGLFSLDYTWRPRSRDSRPGADGGPEWWTISAAPLTHPAGGAVISLIDITSRRRAELEAQRMRHELAHFARVATMGELTASLAHELNQPLTAILANAQAARRFLAAPAPDLDELRAIVDDIVADDRRAGQIIHRLRDMLVKREGELHPVDLNALIEEVVKLLGSDLLFHHVEVVTELAPDLPLVVGDRVQLQQVVLNLLMNAIDAMAGNGPADRMVVVRTERLEGVHVSVRDSGHGLDPATEALVFQPFYTTKAGGMGMGLPVSRSIVEAHGGVMWVTVNGRRGVTFHFALPSGASAVTA
jgi:signal transduction histidine kinase/integral membrane sensor domain MASE1